MNNACPQTVLPVHDINGCCLTCWASDLPFYGDWRFHGSPTWWEKGLVDSSSPCLSVCKTTEKIHQVPQSVRELQLRRYSPNQQLIREMTPRRRVSKVAHTTRHKSLTNLCAAECETQVTFAHVFKQRAGRESSRRTAAFKSFHRLA